jgi:seryl-tRNA synthetase
MKRTSRTRISRTTRKKTEANRRFACLNVFGIDLPKTFFSGIADSPVHDGAPHVPDVIRRYDRADTAVRPYLMETSWLVW